MRSAFSLKLTSGPSPLDWAVLCLSPRHPRLPPNLTIKLVFCWLSVSLFCFLPSPLYPDVSSVSPLWPGVFATAGLVKP